MGSKGVFVLRLKGREDTSFRQGVIGIGWRDARDLGGVDDWEEFKRIVGEAYPDYSARGLGNVCGSIWKFVHEMKSGSLVVVPLPNGAFQVAEVIDDEAFYDEQGYQKDYAWRRKAKWVTSKPVPRNRASNVLQRRLKCQQTCIEITELYQELQAALERQEPVSFKSELYDSARNHVVDHLLKSVTSTQLEVLISKIFQAQGYQAERLHTVQDAPGDVDVRLVIDVGLGAEARPLSIGIQIKQHEGLTDKHAVEQIRDRLEAEDIDRGMVVSTAEDFDEGAKELAKENDIALVSREELADWVLDNLGRIEG